MLKKSYGGHFISLEGGEGAGKSSLLQSLADWLTELGYPVIITREPGGTELGETIRNWVLKQNKQMPITSQAELLLFLAARSQHIHEKILPALQEGKFVLCDRFNDSTIAYQGGARELGIEYVSRLCHLVCGSVKPHYTFVLDVDPQVGLNRSCGLEKDQSAVGELDRIEAESLLFHQKIRDVFKLLVKNEPARMHLINANLSQEHVKQQTIELLERLLFSQKNTIHSFLK